jgi:hypothetical protein
MFVFVTFGGEPTGKILGTSSKVKFFFSQSAGMDLGFSPPMQYQRQQ